MSHNGYSVNYFNVGVEVSKCHPDKDYCYLNNRGDAPFTDLISVFKVYKLPIFSSDKLNYSPCFMVRGIRFNQKL